MIYINLFWVFGNRKSFLWPEFKVIVQLMRVLSSMLSLWIASEYQITFFPILDFRHFSSPLCNTNQRRKTKVRKGSEIYNCIVCTSILHSSPFAWTHRGLQEHSPLAKASKTSFSFYCDARGTFYSKWSQQGLTLGLHTSDYIACHLCGGGKVLKISIVFYYDTM